jgi:DNA adenine methylase
MIKSPLNYTGGKLKLLPQILPMFPENINTFVDLFAGGCNVGLNVNSLSVVFNDNLTYLVDMYNAFKSNTPFFILSHIESQINTFQLSKSNSDGYLKLRSHYNTTRNPLDLFLLISFSFNHQIRFNSSHHFNTPFGKNRSAFNEKMRNNLLIFLAKIQEDRCSFSGLSFEKFDFSKIGANDLVYCDPPYLITTGSYNDGKRGFDGWTEHEELNLLNTLDDLSQKGIKFALSNVVRHKGLENKHLISWIEKRNHYSFELKIDYSNSSYQTKDRSKESTKEVLILNYKPKFRLT